MKFELRNIPERIICLTEEPTEILYLLEEDKRIVGISAYTVRPERAKEEKPVVSAFIHGSVKKIVELEPDLIIGFSDIQAKLASELISANQQVLIFNQRSIQDILDVILCLGRLVGAEKKAETMVSGFINNLSRAEEKTEAQKIHPKVYFEEWDDPQITGILWVSELIELAGGKDIFAHKARGKLAKERHVTNEEVIASSPEIVLASWCGKKFNEDEFLSRPGIKEMPAVIRDEVYEIDPSIILQPGPACITDGLIKLESIIRPSA